MHKYRTQQYLFWLALAAPVAIHFTLLFLYAVNAPRLDDFSEILTFLPDWHATASTHEKLSVFFRDYQNHRYVFYHALLVMFDHINFRNAAIIGNLPLLMLSGMLITTTKNHPQKIAIWIITPLLLFNLQTWRAMYWGPLGTANLLYPCIALLTCRLAVLSTRGVFLAGVMTAFLTLAHGSGPILLPVIAAYLWLQMRAGRYSNTVFFSWLLFSMIVTLLYFFVFPLQGEAGYSSHSSVELLQNFSTHTMDIAKGFLALLGGVLLADTASDWKEPLAICIGAFECLWLGWLIRCHNALRAYPALLLWLSFLLLTALSIASGRVAYAGIAQAMQGHYKLISSILLWFVMAGTLEWLSLSSPRKPVLAAAITVCAALALYLAALLLFLAPMRTQQQALFDDIQQWQTRGKLTFSETVLYVKQPNKKLKAAFDGGFYNPAD